MINYTTLSILGLHIHIYIYVCVYVSVYIYVYMYRVDIHTSRITIVDSPTYRWENSRIGDEPDHQGYKPVTRWDDPPSTIYRDIVYII